METAGEEWDGGGPLWLWWAPLDLTGSSLHQAVGVLSDEERARADQYLSPLERDRFVAARATLRRLLGAHVGRAPQELVLVTDENGKPRLAGTTLRFNASRNGAAALFATSWETDVGVDVEAIRADADVEAIAARFFSATEQQALAALAPEERRVASFQCWTRKEAYLKGIGTGLRVPPESIEVWAAGGGPATIGSWTVHQVEVAPGFAAAVAGEGLHGWVPSVSRTP